MRKRGRKPITPNADQKEFIMHTIEDYILEHHKLCGISEVIKITGLPETSVKKTIEVLCKEDKLRIIYQAPGNPDIYIPTYTLEEILRVQKKPKWLRKYEFSEKKEILDKIKETKDKITNYEILERLLYGTGRPLEIAVTEAIKRLDFEDVKDLGNSPGAHDIQFIWDGKIIICEVKGKQRAADKDDVLGLDGWIRKFLEENTATTPNDIQGFLIVNHFKDLDPHERWPHNNSNPPLTTGAKKFLDYYRFKFITTPSLFDVVKDVIEGKITISLAQTKLMEGKI